MSSLKALTTGSTTFREEDEESGDKDGDRLFIDDVTQWFWDTRDVIWWFWDTDDVTSCGGGVGEVFLNNDW